MAYDIRIPRLGWSMDEGTFQGWLKQEGDPVKIGEPLFELEGEKALQEIESVDEGVLHIPPDGPRPGDVLAVGALLGYLLEAGESPPSAASSTETSSADISRDEALPLPSENGHADRHAADWGATPAVSRKTSSPRARRVARELGVDWKQVDGSGENGRVREVDIRSALPSERPASATEVAPPPYIELPLSARRKVIAERMWTSHARTVPVTLFTGLDATNLVAFRDQFKQASEVFPVPAYTDIVACLCAAVLHHHPRLAARWNADQTGLHLPTDDGYHIGIAVDTPDGLVVPVLRDVSNQSFAKNVFTSQNLIERARSGKLTAAEMQDGVFTVTSLGGFGVTHFTPVINYPETAILGVGAIRREAIVLDDDRIVPGHRMNFSLTFDHAAIDGAPAAAFLQELRNALENPAPHLTGK